MVPFSFENLTRAAGLETFTALPVSDSARATHESFESHLQRATASIQEKSPREAPRHDTPSAASDDHTTEGSRNPPAQQNNAKPAQSDDGPTHEETPSTSVASTPDTKNNDDENQESKEESEVVVVATGAEQPVEATPLEVDFSIDVNNEAEEVTANKPDDTVSQETATKRDTNLSANERDQEVPSTTEHASTDSSQKQNSPANEATQQGEAWRDIQSSEETEATTDKANPGIDTTKNEETGAAASGEIAPHIDSKQPRRNTHEEVAQNQNVNNDQSTLNKLQDAVVAEATNGATSGDTSEQRHNSKDADPTPVVTTSGNSNSEVTATNAPTRFAQHLLARTGTTDSRGSHISAADQTRFVDRVARAVQATGDRGGPLRLRLSPPELGSMTLEVKVQGSSVTARIEADTPAARALLLEHLPVLRDRLAEQGMRVDQFDVDLTDRQPGGTPDGLQQQDRRQQDHTQAENRPPEREEVNRTQPRVTQTNGNEQLNVIV
ncbi:MAG: flagellar hook-length control protein FliK [Planctomycetaceae bacterium]|nr:flagellar hook-length control protein FliK [Planctomycetales bacterium]MCB9924785.1 flagellar hook-length control protein FliK [Planctomycetaceae bacterium]